MAASTEDRIKQIRFLLISHVGLTLFTMTNFIAAAQQPTGWKIWVNGLALALFLLSNTILIIRLFNLQKRRKAEMANSLNH